MMMNCLLLPDPHPFTEAQQVQLRAQIIVYGSLVRNRVPEETLMSLCFADISKGSTIQDFHERNLRSSVWHKTWQGCSKRGSVSAAPRPVKAPKPAPVAAPKRKTAPLASLDQKVAEKKQKVVKEKNISEIHEVKDEVKPPSEEETEQLIQFAACMKSLNAEPVPPVKEASEDMKAAVNGGTSGDLTAESGDTDEVQEWQQEDFPEDFVEGARVEVVSDEEGLHGVWFAGRIGRVRHGKLLIIYEDLLVEDGKEQLQEWVPVYDADSEVPKVRLAHPVTSADVPLKNTCFSVGDHVDVWMNDGWWEGVVEGINSENRKEVTLFFPGEGDIGAAKVSNLRPSLVWKDGEWIPWTQEPAVKKVRQKILQEKVLPVPVRKLEPVMLLEGKRKRERPKRLADGLDDDQPARKPYTKKGGHGASDSPTAKKAAAAAAAAGASTDVKARKAKNSKAKKSRS